ncbi:period circadian protein isoform X2 [Leptopilina heterotoma]|uniref:period circadian protein isoform X2 n=1 Tax=Leptopilina heterotoma TaxID=63436 RepID=UPI001CA7CCDF|nr:period circadian protein isoform X2 [Leptopilina heterotoma]
MSKSAILETSTENAKITDSGYSNSCSNNSRSLNSNDCSKSKNSNGSGSYGYGSELPSNFGSSNEALPQPINKRKDTDHKKKSKTTLAINADSKPEVCVFSTPLKTIFDKITDEQAVVEMMDITDTRQPNDKLVSDYEAGLDPQINSQDDYNFQTNDKFTLVISMRKGLVVYTTFSGALGYSEDDWKKKSFLELIHPSDKEVFFNRVNEIIIAYQELYYGDSEAKVTLFCKLQYKEDFDVKRDSVSVNQNHCEPFNLTLTVKNLQNRVDEEQYENMFLVVKAQSVQSAYKESEETILSSIFTTHHTATCHISHVDPEVVQYLGYLPQDMIGRSLFDFYHPEDLPFIKDVYKTVLTHDGISYKSKPYRFIIKNGDFVVLETDWTAYINPWTRKLEHIQGQHRVIKGPVDPNIFRESDKSINFSDVVLNNAAIIQKEILTLLQEEIEKNEKEVNNSCKYLVPLIVSLFQEILSSRSIKDTAVNARSFSGPPMLQEHESVILGGISPHREYEDSKSSTETPPSYSQLNYNENMQRFFKSNPMGTANYGSYEDNTTGNSGDETVKKDNSSERKYMSPNGESGQSGSDSGNGFNSQLNSNTMGKKTYGELPILTVSLLNKHNEDMEKMMVQKHKIFRSNIKKSDKLKESRVKAKDEEQEIKASIEHGIKRRRSNSRDKSHKVPKKVCKMEPINGTVPLSLNNTVPKPLNNEQTNVSTNTNLWSPHSISVPSINTTSSTVPSMPLNPLISSLCYNYFTISQNQNPCLRRKSNENTQTLPHSTHMMQQNSCMPYKGAGIPDVFYPTNLPLSVPVTSVCKQFLIPDSSPSELKLPQTSEEKSSLQQKASNNLSASTKEKLVSSTSIFASSKKITDMETNSYKKESIEGSSTSSFYSSFLSKSMESNSNSGSRSYGFNPQFQSNLSIDSKRRPYGRRSFDSDDSIESQVLIWWKKHQQDNQKREQQQSRPEMLRKEPPWLKGVQMSPALIYQYQIPEKSLKDVLNTDMKALMSMTQPALVREQLNQLYTDLELEGFEARLKLEEEIDYDDNNVDQSDEGQRVSFQRQERRKS